jgi:signal transduction histidine kinase
MRLRNQLLILVFSVLVPAFVGSILAVWYVYKEEQAAQEKGMTEAARAFSLLVDNELQSKAKILQTLASSPSLVRNDLREFYHYAKTMAPNPETTIILLDKRDHQLINTRLPFGSDLPKRRPSNINEVMERYGVTRPLASDVFFAPIGKRHDFILQVPVMQGTDIQYFLVMGVNVSEMQPLLVQQNLPDGWLGVIVDRKGVVVARSREPNRFVGKASDENVQKLFTSKTEGVVRSVTLDGVPVKTFFNRVAFSDWTIVLSIPEAELRRTPIQVAAFLALMMAILLGFAFMVARRIAARVIVRMDQLGSSADRLGRGEEVLYQRQGLVEIDSVGDRIVDASRQIRQSKLELEQRVTQAVAETERVQRALLHSQKLEALGRLTGGIAHEFNNLLQTLTTALQLARMASNQERVQSLIDTCDKALKRATSLTSQLSAFGRTQDARLETVNLDRHVKNFEDLVENILPTSIALEINLSDNLWPVTIDPTQFELALINLAINARDAMPSGGSIRVKADNETLVSPPNGLAPGDYVRVALQDSGHGMAANVMVRALDPFFTTKKIGEGTGLGLPQAYGFARQSGGTLLLHSSEGHGTTVEIYLPKSTGIIVDQHIQSQVQEVTPITGKKLLFVEDDPLVRESVVPALEKGGFEVLTAHTADQALALLIAETCVDVVFSDVVMPGSMSGVELAKEIRERLPHVKVVLATGYSEQRVSLQGVQVLAKPYDIADALRVLVEAAGT